MLTLSIGNQNYSSWSMRPWVLMREAGIPFEQRRIRFDGFGPDSDFKRQALALSPAGQVPILVDESGFVVWDSLAIAEFLNDRQQALGRPGLWPTDPHARARARTLCAEMHAGYRALRQHCPMNIEAQLPEVGQLIWRDQAAVRADVAQLTQRWETALAQASGHPATVDGGPLLFGGFSVADAYFAPVVMRLLTYQLPVSPTVAAYCRRVAALQSVRDWVAAALKEQDFLDFEEPYRLGRP